MKIDQFIPGPLEAIADQAKEAERAGVDGVWMGELTEDVFLYALRAAEHSARVDVGTSIAVALARSPMSTAYLGYSLNRFAQGRFILGLGSQVRSQIEKRFSMPWDSPVARMTEYVAALRAIWSAWQTEEKLDFRGEFYKHTSMDPPFTPPPSPYGPPEIYLAAVNSEMVRTAARTADGVCLMLAPPRYLREVVLPVVEAGLAESGRRREDFVISLSQGSFLGINRVEDDEQLRAALETNRRAAAYYFSVPNYRSILDFLGYGWLQTELHDVRHGDLHEDEKWARMASMIPNDLLLDIGTYGSGTELPALLQAKFGGWVDRLRFGSDDFYAPGGTPAELRRVLS